ncbi:chromatin assembly factor 1 subunit B-like [Gigantopelta aegis]|uniref:chromatin assembly factor 1 subunit B-like n=1 Tax=Gigantopelta aegis TaxID=1735272 RepID=UPI001B88A9D5|nr:chromatin assembly factor 1 subunit B-like [Gigantopelta aegis]
MKVVTPMICWHEREPIYSIDLQPGNHSIQRLATACVDKTLRMWELKVNDGKCDIQFLSTLSRHSRSVNACRFSPDGDTLASAGDDCVIAFWKLNDIQTQGNLFQDDDEENKEVWVTYKMLRGHLEDVYDICWSADGKFLISGSVDNSAILWDLQKDTKLALLNDHKSFVQGVAWDPLNEFVATLSTDRSCRVFSITGKNCLHNVSKMTIPQATPAEVDNKPKPFKMYHDDGIGSFFRRLSFSPCGQFLITPAGCVEQGDGVTSATFIFTRNNLSKPALYLPSPDKATLAVRVCPQLFTLRKCSKDLDDVSDKDNNNVNEWEKCTTLFCLPYRVVFAVATEDAVLLYDTQQATPFGYISNIHYRQMSDLSWSQDGRVLVISSTDGYCSVVMFEPGELGVIYQNKETGSSIPDTTKSADSEQKIAVSPDKNSSSCESPMETEPDHTELHLALEDSNDASPKTNKKHGAPSNRETSPKNSKDQHITTMSNSSPMPVPPSVGNTTSKDSSSNSGGSVDGGCSNGLKPLGPPSSGGLNVKSATGQHRRIQLTTISLLKPK